MRRIVPIVLALGMLGCRADPETGRLATGSEAIVYSKDSKDVFYADPDLKPYGMGTKVIILDDADNDIDVIGPGGRYVRVAIKDGPAAGGTDEIQRKNLRPVP